MGLWVMIAGLVLFLGVHTLTTQRDLRARMIAATGDGTYKILYSLVSAVGLALIVWGFAKYRATGWIDVWSPPVAMRHRPESVSVAGRPTLQAPGARRPIARARRSTSPSGPASPW